MRTTLAAFCGSVSLVLRNRLPASLTGVMAQLRFSQSAQSTRCAPAVATAPDWPEFAMYPEDWDYDPEPRSQPAGSGQPRS